MKEEETLTKINPDEVKELSNKDLVDLFQFETGVKDFYDKEIKTIEDMEEQKEVNNEKETGKAL